MIVSRSIPPPIFAVVISAWPAIHEWLLPVPTPALRVLLQDLFLAAPKSQDVLPYCPSIEVGTARDI
jgi:hypothetical protein